VAEVAVAAPTVEVTYVEPTAAVEVAYVEPANYVFISPEVQVIENYDYPVFFHAGLYYRYDGGVWYSSSWHDRGWVTSVNTPTYIAHIDRPTGYTHFHASATARVGEPGYRAPTRPVVTRPAGPPPKYVDHPGHPVRGNVPASYHPQPAGAAHPPGPMHPTQPAQPAHPATQPQQPGWHGNQPPPGQHPAQPAQPAQPMHPAQPAQPAQPMHPTGQMQPHPAQPAQPAQPAHPAAPPGQAYHPPAQQPAAQPRPAAPAAHPAPAPAAHPAPAPQKYTPPAKKK
jgi:hypothetical protein